MTAQAVPPAGHTSDPPRETVPDLLRAAADTFTDHVAVRGPGATVTYGQLAGRVRAAAAELRLRGVQRGDLVGLSTTRTIDLVVAALAILEVGAGIVPVDPRQAPQRVRQSLAELDPAIVLVWPDGHRTHPRAVPVTDVTARPTDDAPETSPPVRITAGQLAYVAHTSGSQGRPKAVPVPHGALANRIMWAQGCYPIGLGDTVLHAGSLVFDFSFWEILAPLCFGAAIAMAPEGIEADPARLSAFLVDNEVTVAHFVPSLLAEFLGTAGTDGLRGLRYFLSGGERLSVEVARRLLLATSARVFNQYGPAETCIDVLACEVRDADLAAGTVPLGRPISGVVAVALAQDGSTVEDGMPGELHVGGACLAWGYHGMGARTAADFAPDPFSGIPGARLYRTGDVVRRRPDGTYEFLGRTDDQVKVLGVRIDPAEVEDLLLQHPAVAAAAVVTVPGDTVPVLVAHLVCAGGDPDDAELRALLADRLPVAALPARFARHPELPRLAGGKVDRAALASAASEQAHEPVAAMPPVSETESRVAEIWSDVLGTGPVGLASDFFELGGQSLLAMRMIARVRRRFGLPVPARAIFDAPTVQRFAAFIDEMLPDDLALEVR
jgi:amino acid adenylation domain-containing protein